ncbi:SDR family NAD(P)-dependent oxidoreductase [Actinomadura rayongensis]|uniref:SDR family oxidoreductase n=1 Tax=Actinomadura rayongensis TaxID=1429076 RepID=A0A6I4W707_9ACTN|nr:SDR family oxidoreductase [Actinomadura rayongensis]MXQ65358.1 SDR family oxidoreductase [Actinomadura rayongensis]
MSPVFTGRTVLITGASGVLGRATAVAFGRAGANVVAAGRDRAELDRTVAAVEAAGGTASSVTVDVTDAASVAAMVGAAVERHGRLDVAFNNAGVFGALAPVADQDERAWSDVVDVNLKGVFLSMKHEIAAMRATGGGAIVNTSSRIGVHGRLPGASAYAASKAAVSVLTMNAAREHTGDGIRINAVSPGPIDSPMSLRPGETEADRADRMKASLPIGRVADADEVAAAVLWLASDEASYVVGTDLLVDGGSSA